MVKLATAREARLYGPRTAVSRWEYINAGLYVFATLLLIAGFAVQAPPGNDRTKAGLILVAMAVVIIMMVNTHDLFAHLAGVDYRVGLLWYDVQLALVEVMVPVLHMTGCVLTVIGLVMLVSQDEGAKYSYEREVHALNMVISGALVWVLGSIVNSCQVYERADSLTQILQSSVAIPLLLGSFFFLIGAISNRHYATASDPHEIIVARSWILLCLAGSLMFLVAGLFNLFKVFMMLQSDGLRLEKLRGGAQERLSIDREGRVPLNWEDSGRSRMPGDEVRPVGVSRP